MAKRGFEAIEEAGRRGGGGGNGDRKNVEYLNWGDGGDSGPKEHIVRFLSDAPYNVGTHDFTVPAGGDASKKKIFVCAEDSIDNPRKCPICTTKVEVKPGKWEFQKAKEKGITLVALRQVKLEKQIDDDGYEYNAEVLSDIETEVEVDDEKIDTIKFGLIRQSTYNFWPQVTTNWKDKGTIMDRDYKIVREGQKLDTTYVVIPLDQDKELRAPKKVEKHYTEFLIGDDTTIDSVVENYINFMSSEEYINREFFGIKDEDDSEAPDQATDDESKDSKFFDNDDDVPDTLKTKEERQKSSGSSLNDKVRAALD